MSGHVLDRPLAAVAAALRDREVSAAELLDEALRRHDAQDPPLNAYKLLDREGARKAARRADERLAAEADPPPFCGISVSVKDLYGLTGHPTFAGTSHPLPARWEREGWLVSRLREQGAVFVGKTHTVELAFGGVGMNPHWGTPRNPRDPDVHRIPGGSSAGAGVSLVEGSALVALGTDTGGSIRIPASMTGTVGQKTTAGRWPTDGVVPLSPTLDTVGALTRTVADAAYFFDAVDPGGPEPAVGTTDAAPGRPPRVAVPRSALWDDCQADVARALRGALDALEAAGWRRVETDGALLDRAADFYLESGLVAAQCSDFLDRELPAWWERLDPIVAERIRGAPAHGSVRYEAAVARRRGLASRAPALFEGADVLALPGHLRTPAPVSALEDDLDAYLEVNVATLRPTCPASALGLCALTLPAGTDGAGMPVGLQLVAPGGRDRALLSLARRAEEALGRGAGG